MTLDTYLRTVKGILATEKDIRIQASHESKLSALARKVARGECEPGETVEDIVSMFHPFVGRALRETLERALR